MSNIVPGNKNDAEVMSNMIYDQFRTVQIDHKNHKVTVNKLGNTINHKYEFTSNKPKLPMPE